MVQDLSNSPFCWHNFNKRFYVKYGLENMTPSFRERVASILFDTERKYLLSETKTNSEIRAEAITEILSLVRGVVPKECKGCGYAYHSPSLCESWNDFRQAILNEIGEGDE